jgi:hypothetical protein
MKKETKKLAPSEATVKVLQAELEQLRKENTYLKN